MPLIPYHLVRGEKSFSLQKNQGENLGVPLTFFLERQFEKNFFFDINIDGPRIMVNFEDLMELAALQRKKTFFTLFFYFPFEL